MLLHTCMETGHAGTSQKNDRTEGCDKGHATCAELARAEGCQTGNHDHGPIGPALVETQGAGVQSAEQLKPPGAAQHDCAGQKGECWPDVQS